MRSTFSLFIFFLMFGCGSSNHPKYPFDIKNQEIPPYSIVSEEYNDSDRDVIYYAYEVVTDARRQKDLELISKAILLKQTKPHFTSLIFFYKNKDDVGGDYTLAQGHWGPRDMVSTKWEQQNYLGNRLKITMKE